MPGPRSRRSSIPVVLAATGLVLTAVAAFSSRRTALARDELLFQNAANTVVNDIERRLDAYIAMLLGGAGLFAASEEVRLPEFMAYVDRLQLPQRYPGIQGIGFSRFVARQEKEAVAARLREQGIDFKYWPEQPGQDVHAIIYLEPQDARNRIAIGYDMHSEQERREAMDRARDTGAPAASGRVRLVQELLDPAHTQSGFLIYVPVYRGPTLPSTVDERRSRLLGFVYSPFRADDLLGEVVPKTAAPEVLVEVYDGDRSQGRLLHRSADQPPSEPFEYRQMREFAGRQWTIVLRPGPGFEPTVGYALSSVVVAGILLSTMVYLITRTQVRERQRAERTAEELRRSEEALRAANQAKDDFLAVISHELRTPLNAIVGWAQMLRKGQVPPDKQVHAIDVIHRNAVAQAMLVEDVLDVSRAAAGRLSLTLETVDAAAVLRAAVESIRPTADARQIAVRFDEAAGLGTIRADAARLQQIAMNLLSNAVKFTPEGGRVEVAAARNGTTVEIRVSDTGIGIEPEFLPLVFDRFRQADTSTTRTHAGLGLGLSIARHLVELHGGTISVESPGPGRGSIFTVRLPAG
jgi:signal transduction histidine kinase